MTMDSGYQQPKPSTTVSPKVIAGGVIGLLALIFVFEITGEGRVNFLFWHVNAPAFLWLVILFGSGVVVGSLFPWLRRKSKDRAD